MRKGTSAAGPASEAVSVAELAAQALEKVDPSLPPLLNEGLGKIRRRAPRAQDAPGAGAARDAERYFRGAAEEAAQAAMRVQIHGIACRDFGGIGRGLAEALKEYLSAVELFPGDPKKCAERLVSARKLALAAEGLCRKTRDERLRETNLALELPGADVCRRLAAGLSSLQEGIEALAEALIEEDR